MDEKDTQLPEMSVVMAIRKFLFSPEETSGAVLKEIKALTSEDKAWFAERFEAEGYCRIKA